MANGELPDEDLVLLENPNSLGGDDYPTLEVYNRYMDQPQGEWTKGNRTIVRPKLPPVLLQT